MLYAHCTQSVRLTFHIVRLFGEYSILDRPLPSPPDFASPAGLTDATSKATARASGRDWPRPTAAAVTMASTNRLAGLKAVRFAISVRPRLYLPGLRRAIPSSRKVRSGTAEGASHMRSEPRAVL